MYITINDEYSRSINEDVWLNDNEDVVGIFSAICRLIDDLKIAKFSVLFKEWDKKFNHTDFVYDFSDVGPNLLSLIKFLDNKAGEYSLGFYELGRTIRFNFNDKKLSFSICPSIGENILYHGELDAIKFKNIIEELINDFRSLLSKHFPKTYEIFLKEKYIIS